MFSSDKNSFPFVDHQESSLSLILFYAVLTLPGKLFVSLTDYVLKDVLATELVSVANCFLNLNDVAIQIWNK